MLPFGKIKESHLRSFINDWNIDQCDWMAISSNSEEYRNLPNNLQMESLYKGQQNMLQWGCSHDTSKMHLDLIKNGKIINRGKAKREDGDTLQNVIAGVLHLHLLRSREQIISWARNLHIDGPSPQGEEKLLEWVRVSFIVLKKAIEEAIGDENSTVQMMLFSGKKEDLFRLKLRIYNLDIELQETNHLPLLTVYDKKSDSEFLPSHQVLKGALSVNLNQVIDEIIRLLPLIEVLIKKKIISQN